MHDSAGSVSRAAPLVRETGPPGRYRRYCCRPVDAADLARFLQDHADGQQGVTAAQLLAAERQPARIGTFLLRRDGAIIACLMVDERQEGDDRVAVLASCVDGSTVAVRLLWSELVVPLIHVLAWGQYRRVDLGRVSRLTED